MDSLNASDQDGVTALTALGDLLRRKRAIGAVGVVMALVFAAFAVVGRDYRASSTLHFATASTGLRGLSGLAGQFGVDLATDESPSLSYYAELFSSRDVLLRLARTELPVEGSPSPRPFYALLGFSEADLEVDPVSVYEAVRERVSIGSDLDAGLLRVHTVAGSRSLAEALNARLLEIGEAFSNSRRQSRASAERRFIQQRVEESRRELNAAEDSLEAFHEANRSINAPHLQTKAGRLVRAVEVNQQVFLSLSQALVEAQIDEIRDTPVFTVLESPEGSADVRRSPLAFAAMGGVFGAGLAAFLVLSATLARAQRWRDPRGYEAVVREAGILRRFLAPTTD